MFIFDNETLPTDSIDRFRSGSRGLSLFVTDAPRANEEPQFYTADPQSNYNVAAPSTFESVTKDNPIPTESVIYEFRGLISPTGFTEAPTLFYLDNGRFFYDYIDAATYLVVDGATPTITAEFTNSYDYFDFLFVDQGTERIFTLDLSEETFPFNDVSVINVGGLPFTKHPNSSTSPGQFFYDTTSQELRLHADQLCGPTEGVPLDLTFTMDESNAEVTYPVLRFDFSSASFDYIDYVSHQNVKYYPSSEVTSGTLIYNRIDKIALCLL